MTTHDDHVETGRYEFGSCDICRDLLLSALENHREHAMAYAGRSVDHANDACVTAYIEYAQKMSES